MLSIRKFVDFRKTIGCAMSFVASGLTSSGFARKKKMKRQQLDGTQVLVRAERWAPLSLMFSESDVENLENRKETPVEKMQTTENGEPKKRRRIKMSYSLALAFFVFFGFHFKHLREENVVDGLKKHILIL